MAAKEVSRIPPLSSQRVSESDGLPAGSQSMLVSDQSFDSSAFETTTSDDSAKKADGGTRSRKPYVRKRERLPWSPEEHERFCTGVERFGREWTRVARLVETKDVVQCRSHAQKYFQKLRRRGLAHLVPEPRANFRRKSKSKRKKSGLGEDGKDTLLYSPLPPNTLPRLPPNNKQAFHTTPAHGASPAAPPRIGAQAALFSELCPMAPPSATLSQILQMQLKRARSQMTQSVAQSAVRQVRWLGQL
ncbi:MAG: hypothetical protein MHM6MM_001982 [Cercozoa sp. M6MM]